MMNPGIHTPHPTEGKLVLGLAGLHHLRSTSRRHQYLTQAFDLGFRYFDVAPPYGNGLNEHALGLFLGARRDHVNIATKFGLAPSLYGARLPSLFTALRIADRLLPGYDRRQARRDYSRNGLRHSVEGSLRRLRTDRIDLLLLHEPPAGTADRVLDDLAEDADRLKRTGHIRSFGVAGEFFDPIALSARHDLDVIQAPLSRLRQVAHALPGHIEYRGYFVYRHYAETRSHDSLEHFITDLRNQPACPDLLVASRSIDRLRTLSSLIP